MGDEEEEEEEEKEEKKREEGEEMSFAQLYILKQTKNLNEYTQSRPNDIRGFVLR